jgi:Zn-dependent peptidase ImmA (M78 family)
VALRTEQYYRKIAEDALAALGCSEPPVPIDAIVESLCIPVRAVNLPTFFTGATIYEDGLPVMIVNHARPEIERRRALAHMAGHVLLSMADSSDSYPRGEGDHREADLVARDLMMPTVMVLDQARAWFNDYRYLSRLFGVTEGTMLERMRELGLVRNQNGAIWDF